jgi:pilus assembly protein CpaF
MTRQTAPAQAGLLHELNTLTASGRFADYWHRDMDTALLRVGGINSLPVEEWVELPWYGLIELWRHDRDVSDILVNGSGREVYIVQRGMRVPTGITPHPSWIEFTQRQIALRSGVTTIEAPDDWRTVDGQPCHVLEGAADRRLRYALTRPPASPDGPTISIRILPERWRTLDDLVLTEVLSRPAAELLIEAVRCGVTILVGGSTGSGKTTLIGALLQAIGTEKRCVMIEQPSELPQLPDSISIEVSRSGASFYELVSLALRQKPDLIVVGEVRGPEAMAMLKGASTGHPGLASIHANDPQSALKNLERMACEIPGAQPSIVRGMLTSQAAPLLVCHIGTYGGKRQVGAIEEVSQMGAAGQVGERYTTNPLFHYDHSRGRTVRTNYPIVAQWAQGRSL